MLERLQSLVARIARRPKPELQALVEVWESQARSDPLWAILSESDKRGRAWKLEEFLATGETDVRRWIDRIERAGARIRFSSALDFGCGVGRLSQALGRRFEQVTGVDISPTMIAVAQRINRCGPKVRYVLNERDDLSVVPTASIDLVLSHITLQHIPPPIAARYLEEFFRVIRPGGVLVFQLPSRLRAQAASSPSGDRPLSRAASRAELALEGEVPPLVAGEPAQVRVHVRNASEEPWVQPQSFPINLGNHWLDEKGNELLHDDGRERLPLRLAPGEEVTLQMLVVPPAREGPVVLEVDLVQEGVRWFQQAGSPTLRIPVRIDPPPQRRQEAFDDLLDPVFKPAPSFAMHGIPKEEVLALIARHGARVLAIDEHLTEWESYGYYVQAAPA